MSYRGNSSLAQLAQEDTRVLKTLSASRWAPGGTEDQAMATDNSSNKKTHTQLNNGLAGSRWAADTVDSSQTGTKRASKIGQKNQNKKNHQIKTPNSTINQPCQKINTRETHTLTTPVTARRIIGALSAEEQVKMENPFFDPAKHKGLGSSRWATQ